MILNNFPLKKNKILINGIMLEEATLSPLLYNCRHWENKGCDIIFFGNIELKEKIHKLGIINRYEFIELSNTKKTTSRFKFIFEALKRNFLAFLCISKLKGKFDVIYSRSSVLDLVIFPYFLKKNDVKIKWCTVFDNTVKFTGQGAIFLRLLAWFFFRISLVLLKKADTIFVISHELKDFLLKHGFKKNKLVVTGNGIEKDLIKAAKRNKEYIYDALFIGRINEAKGISDLLKVSLLVKEGFPDFKLAIIGTGDSSTVRRFKERIKESGLSNNIIFLGYIAGQEKFNIIKNSKLFLFLSYAESFGIALLEAVCSGIKALTYDLPPYNNIYKNNEIIRFPISNWEQVAIKIKEILKNGDFENKNGELLIDSYSWEKIAEIEYNAFIYSRP